MCILYMSIILREPHKGGIALVTAIWPTPTMGITVTLQSRFTGKPLLAQITFVQRMLRMCGIMMHVQGFEREECFVTELALVWFLARMNLSNVIVEFVTTGKRCVAFAAGVRLFSGVSSDVQL